jgi:hypothetical protein
MQRERVEQFLEGILQPKGTPQQRPSRPAPTKSQVAGVDSVPMTVPSRNQVPVNVSRGTEPYRTIPPQVKRSGTENIFDNSGIELNAIDTKIQEMPHLKEEHIQQDQQQLIHHTKKQRAKVYEPELTDTLFAFSDSDDLKKAILYTEVLGKPISLRETEASFD